MKSRFLLTLLAAAAATVGAMGQTAVPEDAISGLFSVSADRQVYFAKGNLQCSGVQSGNYTWSFAENQYDMLGRANRVYNSETNKYDLADKIDLFCYSSDCENIRFGISMDVDRYHYRGNFVDWGTNTIGKYAPNTWRTPTGDEWKYLLKMRPNHDKLFGVAAIATATSTINGMIFLPDNWQCPEGITFKSGLTTEDPEREEYSYAKFQKFTLEQWQKMEAAGAIFLPAAGVYCGSNGNYLDIRGYYQSSDIPERLYVLINCLYYSYENAYLDDRMTASDAMPVRLVQDRKQSGIGTITSTADDANKARKIIRDGQILIVRNGHTYNLQGMEVE